MERSSKIYICHTYYHVLISIIKVIISNNNKIDADIVICDTIPESNKLIESLIISNLFNNVFEFSEQQYKNSNLNKSKFGKFGVLFINSKYKKYIKPNFELQKSTYKEINLFNDWTYIGYYLRANKIYYNLLEDGKDGYKVLDNYIKIDYTKPLKHRIFGFVFETLYFHGKSKYSKVVEVNDDKGISIPLHKIRVNRKDEMFNRLTEKHKLLIYNVFMGKNKISNITTENSVLILTQPLFEDLIVQTEEVQRKVYQDIIDTYCTGFEIIIKPHPRDNYNYIEKFDNVTVIDKNYPTEVLNFNPNIKYKKVITVTSSSINAIDFAEDKIYLGFDWLKKYK